MKSTQGEMLFVVAATWSQAKNRAECERMALWVAGHHLLTDIEEAVGLAVDPPRGPVDMKALAILIDARTAARAAVPASPESAFPLGEVGEDELSRAVEDVFESFTDP